MWIEFSRERIQQQGLLVILITKHTGAQWKYLQFVYQMQDWHTKGNFNYTAQKPMVRAVTIKKDPEVKDNV